MWPLSHTKHKLITGRIRLEMKNKTLKEYRALCDSWEEKIRELPYGTEKANFESRMVIDRD